VSANDGRAKGERVTSRFEVAYWGVRGSHAVPGPSTLAFGGNTSCVEVRCGEQRLIIDLGTGAVALGASLCREGLEQVDVLLSHAHWDHLQGLPFFAPLFEREFRVDLWAAQDVCELEPMLTKAFSPPLFPVDVESLGGALVTHPFRNGDVLEVGQVKVKTARLPHPGGASAFLVQWAGHSYAHLTDLEHPADGEWDPEILDLVRRASVLTYDAMYSPQNYPRHKGWGHSTWEAAVDLARRAGVRRLVLFHHDPRHDDAVMRELEAAAQARFPATLAAAEGMVIDIVGDTVTMPAKVDHAL
jgi:phosphoribosyl 1,2-cyclic phosphodiesterase